MTDPRIAAATITLTDRDNVPVLGDIKWLLVELDEADKAAGIVRIDLDGVTEKIAKYLYENTWEKFHGASWEIHPTEENKAGWRKEAREILALLR